MQDQFRPITSEDLIRKYNLGQLQVDRKRISVIGQQLTKTDGILTDFVEQTTKDIEDIQDQLDGNITSWFYNGVPTLNNAPAVDWTTTALKDDHLGDLYYDLDAGTAYRFILDNGVYQWNLLQDDAAAQALSIARAAQDTADHKRRVFVVQPTPPYDVGDVWWNTANSEMYRCRVAKTEQDTFASTDWINDLKYTDDSTAIGLVNDLRADIVEGYATKTELTQSTDSINASVKALRVITDTQHQIFETTPTPPYNVGDYYIDKTNMEVYDCITAKAEGESYSSADWVIDMELTDYVTQAGVGIFEDAINMEVKRKVGDNEIISKINMTPEQIEIDANKISLAGKQIKMTTDNISIDSTNFTVTKNGEVECTDLYAHGNVRVEGYINATSGYIGGAQIVNNTLKIGNINVDTINGDKVQGGTLNGNNVAITNISASNVNTGTLNGNNVNITNLNASNIVGGSLTAGQINYQYYSDGQCFFRVGPGYANNPYLSAINLARGHGGISFRSSDSAGSVGSQRGYIRMTSDNGVMYIDADNGVNINGIKFYDNYVHAGNLALGGNYLNADSGNLNLNTNSSHAVYANGTRIGGYSDKNTKKNIKELTTEDKEKLLNEIRELPTYKYDYKKEYGGETDNYGIIIQDFEDNEILGKALHITEYLGNKKYNHEDLSQIDLILIQTLLDKIDKLEGEIKDLKERNGAEW